MKYAFAALLFLPLATHAAGRCGDVGTRPWCDTSLTAQQRSDLLLAAMSNAQKISLLAGDDPLGVVTGSPATGTVDGIPELGIPDLYFSDGPAGVREGMGTAFPLSIALGASFDPLLARLVGVAIGQEVKFKGNDIVHGPTVDVMRTGLAGRTFETYGEDPYLTSRQSVQWILGAQSQGVIANVKHFALNEQEGQIGVPPLTAVLGARQLVNAHVDERTLREIYLAPFEAAVKEAGAGTVMCSYNLVNNAPACGNAHLLQDILRDDWGFDGFVVTDYFLAAKDAINSINNGTNIEMPIAQFYQPALLQALVGTGAIPQATLDARAGEILRTLFKFGFFDRDAFPADDSLIDVAGHAALAQRVEEEGTVLLKNSGVLPLNAGTLHTLAIIGAPADAYHDVGGSASVKPFQYHSPRESIAQRAGSGVTVTYDDGSDATAAATLAGSADVAIVFVGDAAKEGVDKTCLGLDCPAIPYAPATSTPQDDLIAAVAAANPDTVVVMETGGVILTPWRDQVAAILEAWYPGQEPGPALARILFGDTDPSGRLPVTLPAEESETPTAGNTLQYPGVADQAFYSEGVLTGYRWYDANAVAPAFPFGHGLSYSRFGYEGLSVANSSGSAPVTVRFTVRNIGNRAAIAVPQIYVGMPAPSADVVQPPRWLKGYSKFPLASGASRQVSTTLDARAFSYWDEAANGWAVTPGCYTIEVGNSSHDLPLKQLVSLGGADCGSSGGGSGGGPDSGHGSGGGALPPLSVLILLSAAGLRRRSR